MCHLWKSKRNLISCRCSESAAFWQRSLFHFASIHICDSSAVSNRFWGKNMKMFLNIRKTSVGENFSSCSRAFDAKNSSEKSKAGFSISTSKRVVLLDSKPSTFSQHASWKSILCKFVMSLSVVCFHIDFHSRPPHSLQRRCACTCNKIALLLTDGRSFRQGLRVQCQARKL